MYKVLLFTLLFGIGLTAYGQKVAMSTATVTDSVRAKINKSKKVKTVEGVDMFAAKDIIQNLTNVPDFKVLLTAIRAAGLTGTLKSKGPLTFFAPTNAAFDKLPKGKMDTLLKHSHNLDLCNIVACHAVYGRMTKRSISRKIRSGKGTAVITTLAGCTIKATFDENDNIILIDENGNKSMIGTDDVEQSNGLIHVINGVLIPKVRAI
ncbi:fasciclin domain-containing protein [Mucilaginibacter polytrichastri]|uniref:FAS1 domain-containing protein n=1 Tax=Mucilaginibacter polytrichastri TaxID=1302689 RepID=A0A1Q5ZXG6_9SPHI|nr:fasciclin domain-containing protein [Mucilaginibacter polytrichastri]OKS86465.1 hypothetical protein RG47T_1921 [Mucilaginibacter polytrichastri]SFS78448.1 Uncaracterized surface protein containing fasciclin (FAS1) repeats [Mucilaginibacter polytrichastri]